VTEEQIQVEVSFARERAQALIAVKGPAGLTVADAIERSGILDRLPEIDLKVNKVGVFGKLATLDQVLHDGDRVEIYAPLIADPKQARKDRASAAKPENDDGSASNVKRSPRADA
jgi:putative ubiquitin-RnfH superfamily antitoxin RatB of RatAB toxin-antitoxin module